MAHATRVVVLSLVVFAIMGLACAAGNAPAPDADDYDIDDDEYSIGTIGGQGAASPHGVVAAPIGGPVPPGAFDNAKGSAPSAAPSSLRHFSAVAGAASAALAGFFYF